MRFKVTILGQFMWRGNPTFKMEVCLDGHDLDNARQRAEDMIGGLEGVKNQRIWTVTKVEE